MKRSSQEIANLLNSNSYVRFDYFINKVPDFDETHVLKHDKNFFFILTTEGEKVLPVWPFKEYADNYANFHKKNTKDHLSCKKMNLDDFFGLLNELSILNIRLAIFPVPNNDEFAVIKADELLEILKELYRDLYE